MKRMLPIVSLALLPLGCVQGGQTPPPPSATASPVAAAPAPVPAAPAAPPESAPAPTVAPRPASRPAAAPPASGPAPAAAPLPKKSESVPASAPAPAPTRVRLIVPVGTLLPLEMETTLSSATNHEGDPALAVLTEDVPLQGFKLDKGAEVRGSVLNAVPAKRVKGQARLVVAFHSVMKNGERLAINTEAIDNMAESTRSKDKKIIAGGAVGGLILGAIKDGKKGAAIGTVLGAAAGTGAVLILKGDEVELPRGAHVTVEVLK